MISDQLLLEIISGKNPVRKQPLVVCCGVGRDSVAMLVGMWRRGIRPDLILFADTGSERKSTYDYIPILNTWLERVGFPQLTIVKNVVGDFKHWPPYYTLEENLLTNSTLPSIAYGFHSCSSKWKIVPQNKFIAMWQAAIDCWAIGMKVRKAIGFDASPHEQRRSKGCATYAIQDDEADKYEFWFPLQEWGWDLARCIEEIQKAGLPVPDKSSCYFCTAMKPWEVDQLAEKEPDKIKRIIVIEARAAQRNLDYARQRAEKKGEEWDGKPLTYGLWRKPVKGFRGATPRPGSMTEYIRDKQLLPAEEIARIISLTPTEAILQGQITTWQEWLVEVTAEETKAAA